MFKYISKLTKALFRKIGISIVRVDNSNSRGYPPDFEELNIKICSAVKDFTMTNPARVNELVDSVKYIVQNQIEGAMVECGVWKGGSSMAVSMTLLELGIFDRDIYLYDTYSGMSTPTDHDVSVHGDKAELQYKKLQNKDAESSWCYSGVDEVRKNMLSTNYPDRRLYFVEGKVEETIPGVIPEKIAFLRLDTDWYESTKHELDHLFPRLQKGGVVILDDYGYWGGAKKAIDEYFKVHNTKILLHRIDGSARIAIKQE